MDCKGHIDLRPGCTECHLDATIERAEKAEAQAKETSRLMTAAAIERDEACANYTQAQEELGKLDAHVVVLESKVAKLREALGVCINTLSSLSVSTRDDLEDVGDALLHARTALKETK